jgi:hypothetical protein
MITGATPQQRSLHTPISSATKPEETISPKELRKKTLAALKKTLLDAISDTCVNMIKTHRERLHRQYKIAEERRASRR